MRTSPDLVGPLLVRDRTGRLSPYDECRLVASIRRMGPKRACPEDLAATVRQFLVQREPSPIVSSERLVELVARVLDGVGSSVAADACRQPRRALLPVERLTELLDGVEGLAPGVAREVAAEVQRGLAAAGLEAPGPGLLREWIDHALACRGVVPRGLQPWLGMSGQRLRHLLNEGPPGRSAEERAGRALLRLYAHEDILPPDVWQAREAGLLDIGSPEGCCRIEALTVWDDVGDARRMAELDALVAGEIRVAGEGAGAALHAALPARIGDRPWVLCTDDEPNGDELPPDELPLDVVQRVATRAPSARLLEAASRHPERWQLAPAGPGAELTVAAASLHLDRLAELAGRGEIEDFLLRVEDAMRLVLAGLSAWELMGPVGPAREAVLRRESGAPTTPTTPTMPDTPLVAWSVRLRGVGRAVRELLGGRDTANDYGDDLVAAVGERLRRSHGVWRSLSRAPLATSRDVVFDDSLFLEPLPGPVAEDRTREKLHKLRRIRRPSSDSVTLGDPELAGRRRARWRALLGVRPDRPVLAPGGDPIWRAEFLNAFFRLTPPSVTTGPCA